MNSIFKNAFFGKMYKTRDDRKAVYLGDSTCWIEGGETEIGYSRNGLFVDFQEHGIDIVSEWQEPINKEELDKLAEKIFPYEYTTSLNASEEADYVNDLREAFKKEYIKVLKQ